MRIRIVDAFTDRPFAGNPAAVAVLDDEHFPDPSWMGALAAELNLSETAFAHRLPPGGEAEWALRWFTPAAEVDLCGHATLATAHTLFATGAADGTVRFATRGGILAATGADGGAITLDFPAAPLDPVAPPPGAADAVGAAPVAAYGSGSGGGQLMLELADEAAVRGLAPDPAAIGRLPYAGVIVTAPATGPGHDYVSRYFAPAVGIPEDPVTGSAHTSLAPLWSGRLGREELTGLQVSARTGRVRTTLRGARVLLTGHAVTVLDGLLADGV